MVTAEQIVDVLNRVRPALQVDGGDIELVAIDGNSAHVRLTGRCAGRPSAYMTLHHGVEMALRRAIRGFRDVHLTEAP